MKPDKRDRGRRLGAIIYRVTNVEQRDEICDRESHQREVLEAEGLIITKALT